MKRSDGFSGQRYIPMWQFPRALPKDKRRVLVHNHIMHTVGMPIGVNGFRTWTQIKSNKIVHCKCGWAGLPHYRVKAANPAGGTSVSDRQMDKMMRNWGGRWLGALGEKYADEIP
jgi:hypothetical protein